MNRWLLISGGFVSAVLLTAGLAVGQTSPPSKGKDCVKGAPDKIEGQVMSVTPDGRLTVRRQDGQTVQFQVSKEMARDMKPGDTIEAKLSSDQKC
jgi:translation initiation factor IF-1